MEKLPLRLPSRVVSDPIGWVLEKWLVKPGDSLYVEQKVARLNARPSGAVDHVVAPKSGTLVKLHVREGTLVDNSNLELAEIEFCSHSVVFNGVCALCGAEEEDHFSKAPQQQSRLPVAYSASLSVTQTEAESVSSVAARRLFESKQLSLVLDLDHTLVHATDDPRTAAMLRHSPDNVDLSSLSSFNLPSSRGGYRFPDTMHLKLRPSLADFLERVAVKFNLHIYTMGSRLYADRVARLIDPDSRFFGGRITSREDFPEGKCNQKSIERLFPCDDSMVLIIDDREDVWISNVNQSYMPNLIRAQPYHFWAGMHEAYDRVSSGDELSLPAASGKPHPKEAPKAVERSNGKPEDRKVENGERPVLDVNQEPESRKVGSSVVGDNSDSIPDEAASANIRKDSSVLPPVDGSVGSRGVNSNTQAHDQSNKKDESTTSNAPNGTPNAQGAKDKSSQAPKVDGATPDGGHPTEDKAAGSGEETARKTSAIDGDAEKDGTPESRTEKSKPGQKAEGLVTKSGRTSAEESTTSARLRGIVKGWWDADMSPKSKNHLLRLAQVLEDCHKEFFRRSKMVLIRSENDKKLTGKRFVSPVDVKDVLADLRKKVLAGCVLTFSGLIQEGEAPETVPEWNLALRLGATCSMEFVNGRTTHVVIPIDRPPNTQKCVDAMKFGTAFVVTSQWVEDTALNFERQSELDYCESAKMRFTSGEEFRAFVEQRHEDAAQAMRKRSREELDEISSKEVVGVTPPYKRRRLEPEVAPINSIPRSDLTESAPAVRVLSHDDIEEAMDSLFDE